jgi:hypothetical protein
VNCQWRLASSSLAASKSSKAVFRIFENVCVNLDLFTVQGELPTAEANSPFETKPLHNFQPRGGILLGIALN